MEIQQDDNLAQDWTSETDVDGSDVDINSSFLSEISNNPEVSNENLVDSPNTGFTNDVSELAESLNTDVTATAVVSAELVRVSDTEKTLVASEPETIEAEIIEEAENDLPQPNMTEEQFLAFINSPPGRVLLERLHELSLGSESQPKHQLTAPQFQNFSDLADKELQGQVGQIAQLIGALENRIRKVEEINNALTSNTVSSETKQQVQGQAQVPGGGNFGQSLANFVGGLSQLGSKALNELGNSMKSLSASARNPEAAIPIGDDTDGLGRSEIKQNIAQENKLSIEAGLANMNFNNPHSSIPSNTQFRLESLQMAEQAYLQGLDELWHSKQLADVYKQVEEYADQHGLSKQDVISRINSDSDMMELSNAFNSAINSDPAAKQAKEKLDLSLKEWMSVHEDLTEDFCFADTNNAEYREAFDAYQRSEKNMKEAAEQVPKFEDNPSHIEQLKEFMERMKERIMEITRKIADKVMSFFGKNGEGDVYASPAP